MRGVGGIGMVVDLGGDDLVVIEEQYGFRRVDGRSLRTFLPLESLCGTGMPWAAVIE